MELHRAECPNCAAALDLSPGLNKGVVACGTCGSVLNAASEGLEVVANVASGTYDPIYPITLGQDWTWRDKTYRVSGRLRYRYDDGFWDEWFCIADDGQTLWLEDDEGALRALDPLTPSEAPTRTELEDATRKEYRVDGLAWRVKERGMAAIEWFEGQLPWRVKPGTEVQYLDLKGGEKRLSIEWTRRELEFYHAHRIDSAGKDRASGGFSKSGIAAVVGTPFVVVAAILGVVFLAMCFCCVVTPSTPPTGKSPSYRSDSPSDRDAGSKRRSGYYGGGRGGGGGGYGYGK